MNAAIFAVSRNIARKISFELAPERMKYLRIKELADATGLTVGQIRSLWAARKLPGIKAGHRTLLFELEKVKAALQRFEVKEVTR